MWAWSIFLSLSTINLKKENRGETHPSISFSSNLSMFNISQYSQAMG
jgi:hypothetical protein